MRVRWLKQKSKCGATKSMVKASYRLDAWRLFATWNRLLTIFASDPDSLTLGFEYESQYDDEGGITIFCQRCYRWILSSPLAVMLDQWGYNYSSEMDNPSWWIWATEIKFVASLEHPLLTLFRGYEPSNTTAWTNCGQWCNQQTWFQSSLRSILEGLLEGDEDLRPR